MYYKVCNKCGLSYFEVSDFDYIDLCPKCRCGHAIIGESAFDWLHNDLLPVTPPITSTITLFDEDDINSVEDIERYIRNGDTVIVFFKNGDKQIATCQKGDKFDLATGIAMCLLKEQYGKNIFSEINKVIKNQEKEKIKQEKSKTEKIKKKAKEQEIIEQKRKKRLEKKAREQLEIEKIKSNLKNKKEN